MLVYPLGGREMYGARIVLADDDGIHRKLLKEMLQKRGYLVTAEASDGMSALTLIQQIQPDLAIIDSQLPLKNGIDVAKIIEEGRVAPVVLLSSFNNREMVEYSKDTWVFAHLIKPVTESNLFPAIEIAMANYQRLITLEKEIEQLREELATRKILDRAKAILMKQQNLTEPEAFRQIQKQSMQKRKSIRAIAEAIVVTYSY